jgi:spore coat protein CotH
VLVTSTREGDLRNSRTDVPCDVVFDGVELPKSLCHRKGSYGSLSQSKPALNIKFDAVVPQKLPGGISHIILNNAQQDPSLLNEHLGYEIYRRAGQAAPLTAHALVSLNGKPLGLYVIKEHIGKDFLGRSFGKAEREGNLYRAPLHVDFAKYPDRMDLKNEKEDLRSRTDMRAAAAAVKNPTAAAFEETASKILDLDQFITTMALDGILHHRDGPHGQSNNYYMFHRKADDRFVMLPHGMDFLFSSDYPLADDFNAKLDPFAPLGNSGLVEPMLFSWRVRSTPALMARFKATVGKLIRSAWIPAELQARIDQVVAVIRQNTDQSKVVLDQIKRFDEFVPRWRQLVGARKAFVESVAPQN